MSDQPIVNKVEHAMVYAPPATPPRRLYTPRVGGRSTPSPAPLGLYTPPPSVAKRGGISNSSATSPASSIKTDFDNGHDNDDGGNDGGGDITPAQPSISSPSSTVATYSHEDTIAVLSVAADGGMPGGNPFELLATELIQNIAGQIDSDQDLVHFGQTCKHVNSHIEESRNSFWRCRFLSKFEKPRNAAAKKWKNNMEYKKEYQHRRLKLKNGALFKLGKTGSEKVCLQALRDLINDSFSQKKYHEGKYPDMIYGDNNLVALARFCQNENILRSLFDPRNAPKRRAIGSPASTSESLLQAIQTALCPLMLSEVGGDVHDFPSSQIAAYSPACESPIFKGCYGGTVNMDWALHLANFWKYHFTREAETSLFTDIAALNQAEFPQLWDSQLSQQEMPALARKWNGISAFLQPNEMNDIREEDPRDDIMDEFSGAENDGAIQDLSFEISPHHNTPAGTTKMFKDALDAHIPKKRTKTRSDHADNSPSMDPRPFRLENMGGGGEIGQWLGDGWLSPLPSQSGIPGWQRMSMMKYFVHKGGSIDYNTFWAYEGVMLPGGRTILGRWWSPDQNANNENQYGGPFIMWTAE